MLVFKFSLGGNLRGYISRGVFHCRLIQRKIHRPNGFNLVGGLKRKAFSQCLDTSLYEVNKCIGLPPACRQVLPPSE